MNYVDFLLGVLASLTATLVPQLIARCYQAVKYGRQNLDILGNWRIYRMRSSTETLQASLEIKRTFWRGMRCTFDSPYTRSGKLHGRVRLGDGNVFCEFLSTRKNAPFLIVFFNHGSASLADHRLGTLSGVLGENGYPYCSKTLLSRVEQTEEKVKKVLKRYSCIYIPKNASELRSMLVEN